MPQSPMTPTRQRRRSSAVSITQLNRPSTSRKSSVHSLNSPITPFRPGSALDRIGDYGFGAEDALPEGLDNLAAELAEEDWDEEDNIVEGDSFLAEETEYSTQDGIEGMPNGMKLSKYTNGKTYTQSERPTTNVIGTEDDDIEESKVISHDLEDQMKLVEGLCKPEPHKSAKGQDVLQRVEGQLRDLGSQAKLEEQVSKLVTTVDSLSNHLASESRHLQILLQPYISPFAAPIDSAAIDALQPLIMELISSIPAPSTTQLPAIHALNSSSADILSSLAALSDNLYITQQNASIATQRLRSTRDIVHTIRQEFRETDEGLRFLQAGSWDDKLRRRVAASVCREVVHGFEQVCESWRRRLGEQYAVPG